MILDRFGLLDWLYLTGSMITMYIYPYHRSTANCGKKGDLRSIANHQIGVDEPAVAQVRKYVSRTVLDHYNSESKDGWPFRAAPL